jgi:hypothetical protein
MEYFQQCNYVGKLWELLSQDRTGLMHFHALLFMSCSWNTRITEKCVWITFCWFGWGGSSEELLFQMMMSGIDFGLRKENLGILPQAHHLQWACKLDTRKIQEPPKNCEESLYRSCLLWLILFFKIVWSTIQRNVFILVSCPLNDIVTNCSITALYACYFCLQSWRESGEEIASPNGEGCDIFWTQQGYSEVPTTQKVVHPFTVLHVCMTSDAGHHSSLLIRSKGDVKEHDSSGHCVRWLDLLFVATLVAWMCWIWAPHSSDCEEYRPVGYNAV